MRVDMLASLGQISTGVHQFALVTTYMYALALILFPMIFVCLPDQSVYGHSIPFLFLIIANFAVYAGLYAAFAHEFEAEDKVFLAIVGLVSIAFPICVISEFIAYDRNGGQRSSFPCWITSALDKIWFVCLYFSSKFLPADIVLTSTYDLGICLDNNDDMGGSGNDDIIRADAEIIRAAADITPHNYKHGKISRLLSAHKLSVDSSESLDTENYIYVFPEDSVRDSFGFRSSWTTNSRFTEGTMYSFPM